MAASVFCEKTGPTERYIVYFFAFLAFQLSYFRTATTEHLNNEEIRFSPDLQHMNQFHLQTNNPTGYVSCNWHIQRFSKASSNFILCSSTSAKPLTFCEKCVSQYQGVLTAVQDIEKDSHCRDKILNSDILQIVKKTHKFVEDLWAAGHCDNCFNKSQSSQEGLTDHEFSNKTRHFLTLYEKTQDCFREYNNSEIEIYGDYFLNNISLCGECFQTYCKLNRFYEEMGSLQNLCMDLVEMMNVTHHEWNEFNCTIHQKDYTAVVSISIVCCCFPILFYLFAMFLTRKKVIRGTDLSSAMMGKRKNVSSFGSTRR